MRHTPIQLLSLLFLSILTLSGCVSTHQERAAKAIPPYEPHNIIKKALPNGFTRVALLPVVASTALGSRECINSVSFAITEELGKAKRFEVIGITGDKLREWGLSPMVDSVGPWPSELRDQLKQMQIDGVMIIEISQLKGYEPICIGIKSRIVGIDDGQTYWACDEVFDAAMPQVYAAAKIFESGTLEETVRGAKLMAAPTIELSPTKFAKYASYSIFKTLPGVTSPIEGAKQPEGAAHR